MSGLARWVHGENDGRTRRFAAAGDQIFEIESRGDGRGKPIGNG